MATEYFPNLIGIQKIDIETTTANSDTVITTINKNFKFSNEISPSFTNTRFKNLFEALSQNKYNRTLVTTQADITTTEKNFILSPNRITLPESGTTTITATLNQTLKVIKFDRITSDYDNINDGQIYLPMEGFLILKSETDITFKVITNGLTANKPGSISFFCVGKNNMVGYTYLYFNK